MKYLLGTLLVAVTALEAGWSGAKEDAQIVRALLHEEAKQFRPAEKEFLLLYRKTGKEAYLLQAAREAILPEGDPLLVIPPLQKWVVRTVKKGSDLRPVRLLVILDTKADRPKAAEKLVDRWLARSDAPEDLKLAASLEADFGHEARAVTLLQKAYQKSGDERLLLDEAELLDKYLKKPEEAIRLLETHLRLDPKASVAVVFKLIELYAREKKPEKMLALYEKLYDRNPQSFLLKKIVKLALYTRDLEGLTRFLEKHPRGNEAMLYLLYKEQKNTDKAIALAHRRYEETHRPKWLAEEAILTFEKAQAGHQVTPEILKRFRSLFDRALREGASESLYLNYYGYTLINRNLDVPRGIALVRQALKQQPDNAFYLDSLAWGLYKEGQCAEAAKVMQRVITGGGLREPEFKAHWEKIQACAQAGQGAGDHASE